MKYDVSNLPVSEVSLGVRELASLLMYSVPLSLKQGAAVALIIQDHVNKGYLNGKIVTGDYIKDGETIIVWEDL
jgi:hypothetical protein